VLQYPPKELWERTHDDSGISKKYFDEYFEGRDKGYALQIENPVLYREPVNPFEIFDSFSAPQSFRYIREKKL
jgi:predicted transcriptional regulator